MSTVDISPPLPSQSPRNHLSLDDVEFTGYSPGPTSRRPSESRTPIIDVDGGDAQGERLPSLNRNDGRDDQVFIIDELGIEGSQSNRRPSHGAQNRPIIVLDSDEEQGPTALLSRQGSRRRNPRRRNGGTPSFRIFSPSPPPPQHHPIPPVPPLPPIIAEPMPFAILFPPSTDGNNNPQQNRSPFDEPPQSSNVGGGGSGIQLGGGLFSQSSGMGRRRGVRTQVRFQPRRTDDESINESGNVPPRNSRGASSFFGRIFASYVSANRFMSDAPGPSSSSNSSNGPQWGTESLASHALRHLYNDISLLNFGREHGAPGAGFFGQASFAQGPWGRRDAAVGLGPDYDKNMTHPGRAPPGWTYDFGTEQVSESGNSKMDGSEILVCAKCLDPLLANAEGMTDVSETEKNGRRVWGLRCGHVLDGKCVELLMRPESERPPVKDISSDGKEIGNGKQKQADPARADEDEVDEIVAPRNVKGKEKILVKGSGVPTPSPPPDLTEQATSQNGPVFIALGLPTEDNSIRSRLRSRRSTTMRSTTLNDSPTRPRRSTRQSAMSDQSPNPSASTRRRGPRRKRATSTKEIVEARYEWTCPVSGCGCVHVSIKVGGLWKMDPMQGAVGMYV